MRRVVFLLVPGVHLLDLAGPAQVFSSAADLGLRYEPIYVAEAPEITTAQGLTVQARTEWPDPTPRDVIVVPGWRAPTLASSGPLTSRTLRRLREHHDAGGTLVSVCAGADALGRAGLLDGRRCTTHHDVQDELARRHPDATVVRDVLYVVDGRIVTSAGIAGGIDLALHLMALWHGPATAARIAREMVVYVRRNGDDPQQGVMLRHRAHLSDLVHRIQDTIDTRFTERLPLDALAHAADCSPRTLTRSFTAATGVTPLRYQQLLRLEHAEHLIGQGATMDTAARTVGFSDARMLRRLRSTEQTAPSPPDEPTPNNRRPLPVK